MNLIPPIDHSSVSKPWDAKIRASAISLATSDVQRLFNTALPSPNAFGANEVWAFFTGQDELATQVFFPDVAIFSQKMRLVDLFKRPYFACYSDFLYDAACMMLNKHHIYFSLQAAKVQHPYLLIENAWDKQKILNDLLLFNDSALIFLPKSTAAIDRSFSFDDLNEVIKSCRRYAENVTLCVYFRDLDKYVNRQFSSAVSIVSCGAGNDILFYFRLNALISSHKFVAYMEPGTHSLFSSVSDKRQMLIPKRVHRSISDLYQERRYPASQDLAAFNQASQLIPIDTCPAQVQAFSKFLNYGGSLYPSTLLPPLPERNVINQLAYKVYRVAFRLLDEVERLRFS
jgi:hypothetical protein